MGDTEFLYEAFDRYFKKGIAAKERGDIELAKTELLLAAESLKKLADKSDGMLKTTRLEQVAKILDAIEQLAKPQKIRSGAGDRGSGQQGETGDRQEIDSTETRWQAEEVPDIGFDDIAGLADVKRAAKNMIINAFKHEEIYNKYHKTIGGGILMCGLPGNGKTIVARAIAGEAGCKFFNVAPADIKSKWQGEAVRNIRNVFNLARKEERAIIFFDDADPFFKDKSSSGDSTADEIRTELLTQMEGFKKHTTKLLVLAATNFPWTLDTAIYSRFKRIIYVPMPDFDACLFLVKREFADFELEDNFDMAEIADKLHSDGYSGRDIVSVCHFAINLLQERDINNIEQGLPANAVLSHNDVNEALAKVKPSVKEKDKFLMEAYLSDHSDMLI